MKKTGRKILKTTNQLKKAAAKEDWHHDVGVAAKLGKKGSKGLMFASGVAASLGQPEIAAPLAAAGGGLATSSAALHKVHRSKLLKKKSQKK